MPRSLLWLSFACVLTFPSLARAADELERALLAKASSVLQILRDEGHKNLGVVKFRVKVGEERATETAGSLNSRLALKLELALILTNRVKDPLGIVTDVQQTALKLPDTNYLTAAGRKAYFGAEYPLAWGQDRVTPDIFVAGVAAISRDLKTMQVGILGFTKAKPELKLLENFDIPLNLENLIDLGESFSLHAAHEPSELQRDPEARFDRASEEARAAILEIKQLESPRPPLLPRLHPLAANNPTSPVLFDVYYGDELQKLEVRDGAAFLPRPPHDKQVKFVVRRPQADKPLCLVIKVNGVNTRFRETRPDAFCESWGMEPNVKNFPIHEFIVAADKREPIRFPALDTKQDHPHAQRPAETISLSVYAVDKTKPGLSGLSEDAEDINNLQRAILPSMRAMTLDALKQLIAYSASNRRPMIYLEGQASYAHDPIPLLTATIRFAEK